MISMAKESVNVSFPEFTGERAYMIPIRKNNKLPNEYSRWQNTVDAMLYDVDTDKEMYLTIDQSFVKKGYTQRRSGAHIDGNWINCAWDTGGGRWNTKELMTGGIILACNSVPPVIYEGEADGIPNEGGSCDHLNLSKMNKIRVKENTVYIGNVNMIHEVSLSDSDTDRTFVRITLPDDFEFHG